MAEFKKGDRVVFTKDDSWWERGELVARMPAGTLGTYLGTRAWRAGAPWVRLDTGELVCAWATSIAPVEDHGTGDGTTGACAVCAGQGVVWEGDDDHFPGQECTVCTTAPAPLDPAAVKPGATVTVENGTTTVTGKVGTQGASGVPTALFMHGVGTLYFRDGWTLIAHQPAPEPEPEWKPGTVADIEADGDNTYRAIRTEAGWWEAENNWTYADAEVTDVRPLVVIDPADVDVEALTKIADEAYLTDRSELRADGIQAAIRAVLEHLGLNR
jgi:hypothetical protein